MRELEKFWYPTEPLKPWEAPMAIPLDVFEVFFGGAVATRTWLFDNGLLSSHHISGVKVISVGNLTVGGAGKTPAVMYLARRLAQRGQKVAIASRGYGRTKSDERFVAPKSTFHEVGDEPLLLSRRVPDVPVWVGANRVSLVQQARDAGARVVILDDGMQHRRLQRDVELLVVDGAVGFGNARLLPRGPLREPLTALSRVHALWLKTDDANAAPPPGTEHLPLIRASHFPSAVRKPDGEAAAPASLRGQRVIAFAGLARPMGFLRSLQALGADIRGYAFYADHHAFTDGQLASLEAHAREHRAVLVTTEKDGVRLPPHHPSWQLVQDVKVLTGEDVLDRLLG